MRDVRQRYEGSSMSKPWPAELRLYKDRRTLAVAFDDGERFELPAEFLRVRSPSAEVQGHSPAKATYRFWSCIRSAITPCGSFSTICIRPAFSVGNTCSNLAAIAKNIGA